MAFKLITDSCANLTREIIDRYDITVIPLEYTMNGEQHSITPEIGEDDFKAFYGNMREGQIVKTAMANGENFRRLFEDILESGEDILYIGFSSALSGTVQSVKATLDALSGQYPERRCITIDSLCAAMGEGLLVTHAAMLRESGKSIDEVADWTEQNKLRLVHLFTVDDLKYLRRGGRISGATALIGSVLQIKPLMHVDNEGRLVAFGKVRGRKNSIESLLKRMGEIIENPEQQIIYIIHGDCYDEAKHIADEVQKRFKPKKTVINYVDLVIGAHSGPGTLAIFFLGRER